MVVPSLHCGNGCENGISTSLSTSTGASERRTSLRIQKLNSQKSLRDRDREDTLDQIEERVVRKRVRVCKQSNENPTFVGASVVDDNDHIEERVVQKKVSVCKKSNENPTSVGASSADDNIICKDNKVVCESNESKDNAESDGGQVVATNMGLTEVAETVVKGEKSAYALVTETLRAFNKHYLHFVQEEERRGRQAEADRKANKGSNREKGNAPEKNISRRPDLKAISKMMETNAVMYTEKQIGSIPGIDVGYQFFSRAEMVAIGFHSHWLNGIDYIGKTAKKVLHRDEAFGRYTLPLATVIVISGQYEDDLDNCEDVVYTGQGGNDLLGRKCQIKDQVMERGNLALKNCMEQSVTIRVVRGHQSKSSYVGKVYTYDGLYKVVNYWAEKGISGFTVYKFRLKRLEGQPLLTTSQVQFTRGRIPQSVSEIRGLVCEDISGGQEDIPIPATNLVDDPPVPPTGFKYFKNLKLAKGLSLPSSAPGCGCKDGCLDPNRCACARLNGSDFPYVKQGGGRLVEPKDIVFECGPNCGCGPECVNRTSQRGIRFRLEVFRTPNKGWGVRSWDPIPSGAPVCEYIGVLRKTADLDPAIENYYLFDIDCLQTMKGLDGRQRRLRDVSIPAYMDETVDDKSESVPEYCIDAYSSGNITRYINHSCQPNLFVQCVLSSHHDIKLARIVLFAADNIPPLQELSYDYAYEVDSVVAPDGKIRQMACFCGAPDCRKRLL